MSDKAMNSFIIGKEVLGYTDEILFTGEDPLVGLFVEDPVMGGTEMYSNLARMIRRE